MLITFIQAILLASGGILSIGSIMIVILLLISDGGWRNGLAYMVGYVTAYTLIGLSAVLIGFNDATGEADGGGQVGPILWSLLGILLLWMALRNWRKPPDVAQEPPRIFAILDNITPIKALVFGAVVTVLNFKNLAIFLSAVSIVLVSELPLPEKIMIVLCVVLVFCAAVIAPVLVYLSFPQQAYQRLNRLKEFLESRSRPIAIWVPLLFGLIFFMRGVSSLFY